MRYICEQLLPNGEPRLGSSGVMVRHYASDENALRYFAIHLQADHFVPAPYRVSRFPEGQFLTKFVGNLYKRV